MHWFSLGVALLAALAIIAIGSVYLLKPRVMTPTFGLPQPEAGPNTAWWLRLKGSRDIVLGLVVLALLASGELQLLGVILMILSLVPLGDMSLVLLSKGSIRTAFTVHGLTAVVMIIGAIPLIWGLA